MRIVDRATFLALPAGTLFAKFSPHTFDELMIKGSPAGETDFWYQDLIPWPEGTQDSGEYFDGLDRALAGEESAPLDFDCETRDGLFDEHQLFAVFSAEDGRRLVDRLQRALAEAYGTGLA